MANYCELKQIRLALDLNQVDMGRLLGVNTQSAYQAWESNPDKPAAQKALEKAKALFKESKGVEWGSGPLAQYANYPGAVEQGDTAQAQGHVGQPGFPSRPDEAMIQAAAALLDEMVFKGRSWKDHLKREMAEQVAEQMLELRMVGYSGMALDREIRKRILLWLQLANGPETPS